MYVWINGKILKKEEASISVFDHGLLYGDGVFEGIRAYNRKIFKFDEHIKRLFNSANAIRLKIPYTPLELKQATIGLLRKNKLIDAYIRMVITRGSGDLGLDPTKCNKPNAFIIASTITLYPDVFYTKGLRLITASVRRIPADCINPNIKSLNYLNNILAKMEATSQGVPEAIMLNLKGNVAECTGDNIFIVRNGKLMTPPPQEGALEGITRGCVIDIAKNLKIPFEETPITLYQIYTADECFLTGTAAEVVPVVDVDGRLIGNGMPGEITKKIIEEFRKLTRNGVEY